jgi:hypothetical protein
MNAEVFDHILGHILACMDDMDDVQASTLLKAICKKRQVVQIVTFSKNDFDSWAETNDEEPLTNEEWEELEDNVEHDIDTTVNMIEPFRHWITEKVLEVKEKSNMDNIPLSYSVDEDDISLDAKNDNVIFYNTLYGSDITIRSSSNSSSNFSSSELGFEETNTDDFSIGTMCTMEDLRQSRTTDELAFIVYQSRVDKFSNKNMNNLAKKMFNSVFNSVLVQFCVSHKH